MVPKLPACLTINFSDYLHVCSCSRYTNLVIARARRGDDVLHEIDAFSEEFADWLPSLLYPSLL